MTHFINRRAISEGSIVIFLVGDGDGYTVPTHWRRGYYRWQPYGSRDKPEHKLIWIEPVLVNTPSGQLGYEHTLQANFSRVN